MGCTTSGSLALFRSGSASTAPGGTDAGKAAVTAPGAASASRGGFGNINLIPLDRPGGLTDREVDGRGAREHQELDGYAAVYMPGVRAGDTDLDRSGEQIPDWGKHHAPRPGTRRRSERVPAQQPIERSAALQPKSGLLRVDLDPRSICKEFDVMAR